MGRIRIRFRDWWRGYTNDDIASVMRKTEQPYGVSEVITFSAPEFRAWKATMMKRLERDFAQIRE